MHPGSRRSLLCALALAGACLLSQPAAAGEADDHFAKANAAFSEEKYDLALPEYQAAWKLSKSYDIAALLGVTEMRLGKYRDAAEHMAFALAHWAPSGEEELRANVQASLVEVKKAVVTARIKTTTKGATIKVNGAGLDPSLLDTEIYFEPGRRVIEAVAVGYRSARREIPGKAGDNELVTLNLMAEEPQTRGPIPGIVLGGIGVVGIAVGAGLIGAAEGKKSDALKLHDDIVSNVPGDPKACSGSVADPARCKALRDAASSADALGNGGVAVLVFGGLAALATAGYFLLPSRKSAPAKVAVIPVAGAGSGGLILKGAF